MLLIDIYHYPGGAELAYEILGERPLEHGISHKKMPTWAEHMAFMRMRPFRLWLVITGTECGEAVGHIEVLPTNEFGVHILRRHQGRGLGAEAVKLFMQEYEPLPAIPAIRNGRWLANVAPANTRAAAFFQKLGFTRIQETYAL